MRIIAWTDRRALDRLATRGQVEQAAVRRQAARIVSDVARRGDAAVRAWTRRFDGRSASARFDLTRREIDRGWSATPRPIRRAIQRALRNVEKVAEQQRPRGFALMVTPGVRIEQRVAPLATVGCYVPGGRFPLVSTLLMTVIPARVAGVRDITVACPNPAPAILCAAREAGVTRVIRIGGAQAIAALAYGTASIPRVDKIVGPGNAWVAAAKAIVSSVTSIDLHAGPSEIVIWSDTGRPDWIAADLIAQAEHDPAARPIFVTTRRSLGAAVAREVVDRVPATGPARIALRRQGAIVIARNRGHALDVVNQLAPEHVVCDRREDARGVLTAGTVFVGPWSAQASGDYATGSNHVLPTNGAGRFRGGLTTADFVRVFAVQTLTRRGLRAIGPIAIALAHAEGLTAHAESIRVRL